MKVSKKTLVLIALLLIVAISITTYAIYKSSVATDSEVTAAKWNIEFLDGQTEVTTSQTITFGSSNCTNNSHVANGVIAPGATCTKTITLDANDIEVDVSYTAVAGAVTAEKSGSAVATTNANAFTVSLLPASGTPNYITSDNDDCISIDKQGNTYNWATNNKNVIDTGVSLFSETNADKEFELGFTIDYWDSGSQTNFQASFVNSKLENSNMNYPGFVVRKSGSNLVLTEKINGVTE